MIWPAVTEGMIAASSSHKEIQAVNMGTLKMGTLKLAWQIMVVYSHLH